MLLDKYCLHRKKVAGHLKIKLIKKLCHTFTVLLVFLSFSLQLQMYRTYINCFLFKARTTYSAIIFILQYFFIDFLKVLIASQQATKCRDILYILPLHQVDAILSLSCQRPSRFHWGQHCKVKNQWLMHSFFWKRLALNKPNSKSISAFLLTGAGWRLGKMMPMCSHNL